jgi:hypothetical protein
LPKKVKKGPKRKARSKAVTTTTTPPGGMQLYTAAEAANRLRISLRSFEKLVGKKIPPIWVSKGKRMFDGNDIESYLRRQRDAAMGAA